MHQFKWVKVPIPMKIPLLKDGSNTVIYNTVYTVRIVNHRRSEVLNV